MFDQSKLSTIQDVYGADLSKLNFFNQEVDLDWIQRDKEELSIDKPDLKKYMVKWRQLSYLQCTWEDEEFVL